ncbi:hypothetical protein PU560_02365, partial [Georgenia sp. 10Sc9-8]|nr:hypothetical protein [Georgenia halotolerans]
MTESATHRVVVIGGGPAAHRFVEAMCTRDTTGTSITVLADEPHLPYDRVALSKALTGDVDLTLGDRGLWDHPAVT